MYIIYLLIAIYIYIVTYIYNIHIHIIYIYICLSLETRAPQKFEWVIIIVPMKIAVVDIPFIRRVERNKYTRIQNMNMVYNTP